MPINQFSGGGRFSAPSGSGSGGSSGGSELAPNQALGTLSAPKGSAGSSRYGRGIRTNIGFIVGPATQANQLVQCPAYRVPVGAKFTLLSPNTNGGLARSSESKAMLNAGLGDIVPNITPIDYPVDQTSSVWVLLAAVGDFVNARITNDAG